MTPYIYHTREFALSHEGIHLLRSGFNYNSIPFSDIKRMRIEKGREIHNWILIFIIGAVLIIVGIAISINVIKILIRGDLSIKGAKMILLFFIPIVGAFFVYNSLQTGIVLKIDFSDGTKDMFPLKEIAKQKRLNDFTTFLRNKLESRIQELAKS
jgi:hypothetical protein